MPNFTVVTINLCSGSGHVELTGTVAGNSVSRKYLRSDFLSSPDDIESAILQRMRSAVMEANATTLTQIRNALIGPTFKV
jgi:hypothetical protein